MYRKGLNGLDNLVKQPTIYPACFVRRFNEWDQNEVLRLASLVICFFAWSALYTASPQKARLLRPFVLHSFFILFSKNAMMLAFICVWKAFRLNCP